MVKVWTVFCELMELIGSFEIGLDVRLKFSDNEGWFAGSAEGSELYFEAGGPPSGSSTIICRPRKLAFCRSLR